MAERGGEADAEIAGVDGMAESIEVLPCQRLDHIDVLQLVGDEDLPTNRGFLNERAGREQARQRQ